MILDCPRCMKKFNVDEAALQPAGRKVRCTGCQYVWFQDAPDETAEITENVEAAAEEQIVTDTPEEEVAPATSFAQEIEEQVQEENEPAEPNAFDKIKAFIVSETKHISQAILNAYQAVRGKVSSDSFFKINSVLFGVAVVLITCVWIFVGARDVIMLKAPSLYSVYSELGFEVTAPGKDLVFKKAEVEWKYDNKGNPELFLSGAVYNSSSEEIRYVPPLRVTTILKSGRKGDSKLITFPETTIAADGEFEFATKIDKWPHGSKDLFITFALDELHSSTNVDRDENDIAVSEAVTVTKGKDKE